MEPWLLILIIGIVLVVGVVAFVVVPRRGRGPADEPPPRPVDRDAQSPVPEGSLLVEDVPETVAEPDAVPTSAEPDAAPQAVRPRLRDRLAKARSTVTGYLASVVGRGGIDQPTWDELEEALIRADVGATLTSEILDGVRAQVDAEGISDPEELLAVLRADLTARLEMADRTLHPLGDGTDVWLLVGVNGVGKTTTVGKLGARFAGEGHDVVMVAGDTFRAAAAEQLEMWADRCGARFVRGAEGADPSSVVFDGIEAGVAKNADLVLADTAGRLHNKSNLMDELRKVRRVADKAPGNVTEVLLVLDATTGQNGLSQARVFTEATDVTGVVLTKLDGSAKGGIVLAIQSELGIPVKLVGLGESAEDLIDFEPAEFVEALLDVGDDA
ncbi:MAG: signal recognition particle-docking protein FtsY [Actinobacteria bacterium]|nr:signal recognition particle-docking protein FtsY [Actinomycetota bacterium]